VATTETLFTPKQVPAVKTKYRSIQTPIPAPDSLPILERLAENEPRSMRGQPPIVWAKAEGFRVFDGFGNAWIDWSSGVLVANAGHGRPEIVKAIVEQAQAEMIHNYCFPSEIRARLVKRLAELAPAGLDKVFLLTTGAETTECAIKLARTHGRAVGGDKKIAVVSYEAAFHGRTLGAQQIGGIPALKEWIVNLDPDFVQVPFPDGWRNKDTSFEGFVKALKAKGFGPDRVAGVITETYQGGTCAFWPVEYSRKMREWCDQHDIVLIFDEVQAGFGRTGTMWGFEHLGIVPDAYCCGKGITSGLPLSAVIGRPELMDQYPPGSMTSTHTGNPVCAAAALANLDIIVKEGLVEKAAKVGAVLGSELEKVKAKHGDVCGALFGKGMVYGLHTVRPGTVDPDAELANAVVTACIEKGLLMFHPVGTGGNVIKIAPPLITPEDAVREGVTVLDEAIQEVK
jgi:4-aminobutyrate aminotransferase/(S)-3-amino-2-methylpropionate transaminase